MQRNFLNNIRLLKSH